MGLGVLPMMGIGAGLGLLTGGTQGALKGAALGGLGGAYNNWSQTGSLLGASPVGAKVAEAGMAANAAAAAPQAMGNFALTPSGTLLNMDYYQNVLGNPVFTGGQGLVSNALSDLSSYIPSYMTDNLTPQNMLGVANILGQQQRAPQLPAPQPASPTRGGSVVPFTPLSTVKLLETPRRTLIG